SLTPLASTTAKCWTSWIDWSKKRNASYGERPNRDVRTARNLSRVGGAAHYKYGCFGLCRGRLAFLRGTAAKKVRPRPRGYSIRYAGLSTGNRDDLGWFFPHPFVPRLRTLLNR